MDERRYAERVLVTMLMSLPSTGMDKNSEIIAGVVSSDWHARRTDRLTIFHGQR